MSIIGEYYEQEVIPKYEELLKICLEAFNEIPNKKLVHNSKVKSTYELASKIEKVLKK